MPITLMPHNIGVYEKVKEGIAKNNKTAVIQPTGTGKMYIGLKYLEDNKGKKAIYIAPSNAILHDVKKNIFAEGMTMQDFPNLKRITYQKLAALSDEEIAKLEADIIIVDEFHHCGAPVWGKGVERLIERNPNAKILGFSATPIRYNDGLRDMADEMFENNVASEMTLEEAIDIGILPGATYVSTLYGYEQELRKMQANINNPKFSIENRQQAQELLEELRKKLDENTQNLPELLSEHMKNESGKYIVFCKNIDDMNEKMEQAQKMFGRVNPNIKVRGVSSKIKETDRILTEFEQDNEEGTLKLLYAVDMINEGYHVKDLDGVVMMRPTYSPTVFAQQLGRGLTVGNDKETVILDLVNNFDSCKIIADLAERMKQYKGRKGVGEKGKRKSSRLSIFDTTKEFREIAEKITELSKRRQISLEEKIEILEKFAKTGEELVGNTTFEGYPIGQWAVQIRTSINRINRGNASKGELNPSETQLERLEKLGILERQIDSTIEEKIDAMIEWNKQYPLMRLDKASPLLTGYEEQYLLEQNERLLRIHDESELTDDERRDRLENISERFEKLKKYYQYVKDRKSRGKLTEEQISRCKEGNVRGVFGYPENTEKLANDYNCNIDGLDEILSRYGTISNYLVQENLGWSNERSMLFEVNLNNDTGIEMLLHNGMAISRLIYNRDVILEKLNELPEMQRKVLMGYYGINGEKSRSSKDIAKEFGISKSMFHYYKNMALKTLRRHIKDLDITFIPNFDKIDEADRKRIVDALGNYAFGKPDKYDIENLDRLVDICKTIEKNGTTSISDEEEEKIDIETSPEISQLSMEEIQNIRIDELGLSVRTYNVLNRAGIKTVQDVIDADEEDRLIRLRNMGRKTLGEIRNRINEFIQTDGNNESKIDALQEEDFLEIEASPEISPLLKERILETPVEQLNLSTRARNILITAHIYYLGDLLHKSDYFFYCLRGMGRGTFNEIISKLSAYGLEFNEDGKLEFKNSQNQGELENDNAGAIDENSRRIIDLQKELASLRNARSKVLLDQEFTKGGIIQAGNKDVEITEDGNGETELEYLRAKKDSLSQEAERIQKAIKKAMELLAAYVKSNGDSQENGPPQLDNE